MRNDLKVYVNDDLEQKIREMAKEELRSISQQIEHLVKWDLECGDKQIKNMLALKTLRETESGKKALCKVLKSLTSKQREELRGAMYFTIGMLDGVNDSGEVQPRATSQALSGRQ